MTETSLAVLRQLLVERYDDLRRRLTRRLGSEDDARDTLHDMYLRLGGVGEAAANVRSPTAYLIRIAVNLIGDRRRIEGRQGTRVDIDTVLDLVDETPDQARALEGRSAFQALQRALADLTPRQRAILIASKLDHVPRTAIARELGISRRLVHTELKRALEICQSHVEKN
jgi:RNA polymerase sigma-70 factor (ECF subfamily)